MPAVDETGQFLRPAYPSAVPPPPPPSSPAPANTAPSPPTPPSDPYGEVPVANQIGAAPLPPPPPPAADPVPPPPSPPSAPPPVAPQNLGQPIDSWMESAAIPQVQADLNAYQATAPPAGGIPDDYVAPPPAPPGVTPPPPAPPPLADPFAEVQPANRNPDGTGVVSAPGAPSAPVPPSSQPPAPAPPADPIPEPRISAREDTPAAAPPSPATPPIPDPAQTGTGSPSDPNVVFANDPVYQAAQQESALAKKNAASNYLESLKALLLQFGDVNLAHQILDGIGAQVGGYLGSMPDMSSYWQQYVGIDNPDTSFSQMAQYNREIREGLRNATEAINNQGLYYSGAGAKAMSDFQYQSQAKLASLIAGIKGTIGQYGQDFFGRLQGAQGSEIQAMNDAYTRMVQAALQGSFELPNFGVGGTGGTAGAGSALPGAPKKVTPVRSASIKSKPKVTKTVAQRPMPFDQPTKPKPKPKPSPSAARTRKQAR